MNTTLRFTKRELTLFRFPAHTQHSSLQAWGSEDELVLNTLLNGSSNLGRTLILNDEFGAIGCALCSDAFVLANNSIWQSDSYIAHKAFKENLDKNKLANRFTMLASVDSMHNHFDTVLIRLPKNSQFLQQQLQQLAHYVTTSTRIIAFGKVKMVTSPVLKVFETELGETHTSLAVKKSRLIYCQADKQKLSKHPVDLYEKRWEIKHSSARALLTLHNLANVFSSKQLDIGARFMLDNLPPFNDEKIIDLGCGNGVLGLACLAQSAHCSVTFVDESFMAVESAKRSVAANFSDKLSDCEFHVDNCLDSFKAKQSNIRFDRVLCNPPFHQQNTLTDHIAWQMFNDAKACLTNGGKLWVVGNRHLQYHDKLKRVFGGTKVLASNAKFVILEAIKR